MLMIALTVVGEVGIVMHMPKKTTGCQLAIEQVS